MRISRLKALNFRRFVEFEVTFSEGLNLVRGPNESGKSTLVEAVLAGLFARPQSSSALVQSYHRWGSQAAPSIEMDFSHQGERYRLVKDFEARTVSLEKESDAPFKTQKAVSARMEEILGISDSEKYLRTACVTHDQMVNLAEDSSAARKLAVMLKEVVVGDRESATVERALKRLNADIDELKRGLERPAANPGVIKRLAEERLELLRRKEQLSSALEELEKNRRRLREVESLLEQHEPRLAEIEDLVGGNREIRELQDKLSLAKEQFANADRAREVAHELEGLDGRIEGEFERFKGMDTALLDEVRRGVDVRTSLMKLQEEPSPGPRAAARNSRRGVPAALAWAGIGSGLALVVLAVFLGLFIQPALFAIAAPGILVAVGGFVMLTRARRRAAPAGERRPAEEGEGRAVAEIERINERERELLRSSGCESVEQLFDLYREFSLLESRRDRAATELGALLGKRMLDDIQAGRAQASLEVAACEERLKELAPLGVDPEKMVALARERDRLLKSIDELKREQDGLGFHLERAHIDPEELMRVEEELAWLEEAEDKALRRLKVYSLASEGIQELSHTLLSSAVPVLAEAVGRTFSRLTGGRYETIEVRESDLGIAVFSSEKGEMIPAEELLASLSKGTIGQLYLAARLELVDLLSGGLKPPLIFDDSFSYFDDRRLAALWGILLGAARGQQVIMLTCTERYDELAGPDVNVIEL